MGMRGLRAFAALCLCTMPCRTGAAVFTVTSTDDAGAGTLRQAILNANENAGANEIHFNLSGEPPYTIELASSLNGIKESVRIDATTQPGYVVRPLVVLDGSKIPGNSALEFEGGQNTVQGLVISGFTNTTAVSFVDGSTSNAMRGCYVGTDYNGEPTITSYSSAVRFSQCDGNVIGGLSLGDGNVIAGTLTIIGSSKNQVMGNKIGMNASGMVSMANGSGIGIYASSDNRIGGSSVHARNMIFSKSVGIHLSSSTGTIIQGNWIGLREDGESVFEEQGYGITISQSSDMAIGGSQPGEGNVIAGHLEGSGLELRGVRDCIIQGNMIGTGADGMQALSSSRGIVCLAESGSDHVRDVLIGGTEPGAGNVVSGHRRDGVLMVGGNVEEIIVQGNKIGTDIIGTGALGNGEDGISVANGAHDILIGGTVPGAGNLVAFNKRVGVNIKIDPLRPDYEYPPRRVSVLGNTIRDHDRFGLELALHPRGDGRTVNDAGDEDDGPNGLLNTPILTRVTALDGGRVRFEGSYSGAANLTLRLEFFASASLNPRGYTEGERYLGSTEITTDGAGQAEFDVFLNATGSEDEIYAATATDTDGNTSEFSPQSVETVPVELSRFELE